MANYITSEKDRHIFRLTLNRPEKRNAFNAQFIAEVTNEFRSIEKHPEIRCVYLSAEGPAFCAGADLNWMKDSKGWSEAVNQEDAVKLFEMFESVRSCHVPVVTKAHGSVFGGGLGLVAASDIVACDRSVHFCFSEVRLGLVPAVISSFVLSRCQRRPVSEAMLTGRVFGGEEALQMGLVRYFEPELPLTEKVESLLEAFASLGPSAVRQTKKLLLSYENGALRDPKAYCTNLIAKQRVSAEAQEGLAAFLEKRSPDWK